MTAPRRLVEINVIIAAWARGWSQDQIAFAAGVTHQRINQRISAYEAKFGQVARLSRSQNRNTANFSWRCVNCDKQRWSPRSRFYGSDAMVCSMACYVEHRREITDEMIERAIDMRWAGKSWSSISIELKRPIQSIQSRIWKHLYQVGLLNLEVVQSIWQRGGHVRAGWTWLERQTGIICTEDGPRPGPRYEANRSTWGTSLERTWGG